MKTGQYRDTGTIGRKTQERRQAPKNNSKLKKTTTKMCNTDLTKTPGCARER